MRPPFVDHLAIRVTDVERSRRFYERALAPFGIRVVESSQGPIGFGPEGSEDFWIGPGEPAGPLHIAFLAPDRATVDAFHAAAVSPQEVLRTSWGPRVDAGGRDNGRPGLRPQYHAGYYAAYVLDPDGNNVEAVHRER